METLAAGPGTAPLNPLVAWNAAREQAVADAKQAFLDAHPEPTQLDFACPYCKATAGTPCVWAVAPRGSGFHAPRVDLMICASNGQQRDAFLASEAAWEEYPRTSPRPAGAR
ncbi:zinc finger domain-containing protein [Polymorphospora rubra]|nr:hypothetical protein [Polymorphospora rubra]